MNKVIFYQRGTCNEQLKLWDKKLKFWYKNFELIHLNDPRASEASVAMLWKAPMKKILNFKNLKSIISLGQGVDHVINTKNFPKNISVYRIVDPYMAKSMSHWVIMSILNYIRDYDGYTFQQKKKIYRSRNILDFSKIKIGIYGTGKIGNVVANDLFGLGFDVFSWSRTKKKSRVFKCYNQISGFNHLIKHCDIHVCLLPLTSSTVNIFNKNVFSSMKNGVCFINAGRGEQVNEEDLLNFCGKKINLAILDVFNEEPLPKNHPFWVSKNIKVWPHVSAETNIDTAAEQIAKALYLIHNKKIPENKINIDLGY